MTSSTLVHAAVFAVGAVVGGGIATVVGRKSQQPLPAYVPPTPIIEVGTTGTATISANVGGISPVLTYGNPGIYSNILRNFD
jgi:endonuclease G